jgi:nucleotide-binding universal stress UspA family protein
MVDNPPNSAFARIVVATDVSSNAGAALDWAVALAREHGATITLVHAIEPVTLSSIPLALQDAVAQQLASLEDEVRNAGVDVTSRSGVGRTWEIVAEAVADVGADLIVVGARGHTPYTGMLLGSTADRIIRTARVPVLTVHPGDAQAPEHIRTVLVATDFSEEAGLACDVTLRLLGPPAGHKLVLLHAWEPLVDYGFGVAGPIAHQLDDVESEVRAMLGPVAERLRAGGWDVEVAIRQGYPAAVIEREADLMSADLIAVGTRGRTGLRNLMLGSIAERVLHHAPCPVLSVRHPEEMEGSGAAEETRAVRA